jgi:DNA (cytosine-5)-methyltransferase 1
MNHLDLFSGIGGFSLGLKRVFDLNHTYYSEIDKYAIDVYKNNFKNITYVGSVTDVRGGGLPKIDIITFGSPCQDFSMAGKRKGMGGARSSLITEAIRLIEECKPSFFIWENVKGTFSTNNGADFWAIIQAFANIGGYRLEWQLLNTKWFLPQNRERVYLVGCLGKGSGQQVFPITKSSRKINDIQRQQANTCTIQARQRDGQGSYIIERKLDAQEIKIKTNNKKGYEIARPGDTINYQNLPSKTRRGRVGKSIAQTLDAGGEQAVIGGLQKNAATMTNLSPSLTSAMGMGGGHIPIVNYIRRLTPKECERLQGFPDNWTKTGKELGEISDNQRYKMCGNAVTVDVVEAVAKNIKKAL